MLQLGTILSMALFLMIATLPSKKNIKAKPWGLEDWSLVTLWIISMVNLFQHIQAITFPMTFLSGKWKSVNTQKNEDSWQGGVGNLKWSNWYKAFQKQSIKVYVVRFVWVKPTTIGANIGHSCMFLLTVRFMVCISTLRHRWDYSIWHVETAWHSYTTYISGSFIYPTPPGGHF